MRPKKDVTICDINALEILKMKTLPDGAFITNYFSVAVCMQTLKERGINIPGDIAVVGSNNDAVGKIIETQYTAFDHQGIKYKRNCSRQPGQSFEGLSNIKNTQTIVIHSDLVIRESSLKKKAVIKSL